MRTGWMSIAVAMLIAAAMPARGQFASSHATYSLSLASAPPDSPIEAVSGTYDVDVVQTCEGWSYENDMVQRLAMRDGRRFVEAFAIGGIESSDGHRLQFRVRAEPPDRPAIAYSGVAEITVSGDGRLQIDGAPAADLPPGTLFPAQLTFALLEQAEAGTPAAEYSILAGAFERPWRVRFEIEPVTNAEVPQGPAIDPGLLGGRSWRMRATGVNGVQARDALGYTGSAWTFESGVVAEYVYDYGAFAVRARLERLERKDRPSCAR